MLTSILSLYLASALDSNPNEIMLKTATSSFSTILEEPTIPIKNPQFISPVIEAKGSLAMDLETEEVLFEKNMHDRMPIASITKLMTILIILEENDPTQTVIVSRNAASIEGSQMYLREGEQISVENLLYGALIHSANDAAVALAEHNAGSIDKFIEKMNKRTLELGLINTHFSNSIGLDQRENYSSPYDLAKLGAYIYHNKFVKEAAKIQKLDVLSLDKKYTHKLENTNELLNNEHYKFKGLKTGSTDAAGLCLVGIAENNEGHEVITVVLNSPDRFTESKILVDWVFRAYNWL